ncbi:MAG: four helix bundle protein [Candidatus Omnitrophica bacterium]|nr:four helix bundle protein [Candidatus Omnitrophota bacterium]MBU0878392.1 four helix bundle protein [Candidatus Omnitrophota bacterium]MBU0897351.1 four helix bundle protein [Candidatus Omnitrophota bacterium]MBU1134006.1 four helix bundle protein [Candidatus Omnitrophota bacterium]MBU1367176.1 four helix bundle protein [Candidatus Omnitrophota bacterium]
MKTFRELKAWQRAHELVLKVYKVTTNFPEREKFGLISQMRRSSISIPANIVEGFKRRSDKEFKQFINIAAASLEETKYYLILSVDLKYMNQEDYQELMELADEVGKMLHGFYKKLNLER